MKKKHSCLPWVVLLLLLTGIIAVFAYIPILAEQSYGPPVPSLSPWQRFNYSFWLIWQAGDLSVPVDTQGAKQIFVIEQGETIYSIANRLEQGGLIHNARVFRIYLTYLGLDTTVQTGKYTLSSAMTAIEVSRALQDATPTEVTFRVLAGWRVEEVAASLPTSGLSIAPDEFIAAALNPGTGMNLLPAGTSAEGFLYPDSYILPRTTTADQLVSVLMQKFFASLTVELQDGFSRQGLNVYQAVTLASIIERESIVDEEMPLIASVFFNRLAIGMKLETDPTVQYALGYNAAQGTWWTNPLTLNDMDIDSPYNTYLYGGFPPGPISNPGLTALQAVAFPAQTPYYYFRARCDGSGLHTFAETFEQHLQNACP